MAGHRGVQKCRSRVDFPSAIRKIDPRIVVCTCHGAQEGAVGWMETISIYIASATSWFLAYGNVDLGSFNVAAVHDFDIVLPKVHIAALSPRS